MVYLCLLGSVLAALFCDLIWLMGQQQGAHTKALGRWLKVGHLMHFQIICILFPVAGVGGPFVHVLLSLVNE